MAGGTPRISVVVHADDPVSRSGIASLLRGRPEVVLVDDDGASPEADVAVVAIDDVDRAAIQLIRSVQRNGTRRVVLVARHLDEVTALPAIEAGTRALIRRMDASPERLVSTIVSAANGDGAIPADLLGRLLEQVGALQTEVLRPQGLTFSGLAEREIAVLRLISEGHDTAEIAAALCYSERTIKNIIHDVINRLQLRNRSHAVAYAVRNGLI